MPFRRGVFGRFSPFFKGTYGLNYKKDLSKFYFISRITKKTTRKRNLSTSRKKEKLKDVTISEFKFTISEFITILPMDYFNWIGHKKKLVSDIFGAFLFFFKKKIES